MHHLVPGERLRTRYANAPRISTATESELLVVVFSFGSSLIDDDGYAWETTLIFSHVLDLHFFDFDIGLPRPNLHDFKYALIEIDDSTVITRFVETKALERPASPVTAIGDLHHYRIAFDDHGTYDLICTELEISYNHIRMRSA